MKTVRDAVEPGERVEFDGRTVMVLADDDPILDYPVIEPSGVVLAADREKLVGAACAEEVRSDAVEGYTRPLSKDEATAIVDAILTSLAEDGFREVDVLLRTADAPMTISHGPGADIAVLKPPPPAKED